MIAQGHLYPCGHPVSEDNTFDQVKADGQRRPRCKQCSGGRAPTGFKCTHPYTADNIVVRPRYGGKGVHRVCRTCLNANRRKKYQAQKKAKLAEKVETGALAPSVEQALSHDWKQRGLCAAAPDADAWFSNKYTLESQGVTKSAVATCQKCPVRSLCLAAGADEEWGVWGGTTEDQRERYQSRKITFDQLAELAA